MPRNEFSPPEFSQPEIINTEMLPGIRACTRSIFCAGASANAKHNIAHAAKVSVAEVIKQALPTTGTAEHPTNLGNYNLQGTGKAYRSLIHDGILEVVNNHADTVKPV